MLVFTHAASFGPPHRAKGTADDDDSDDDDSVILVTPNTLEPRMRARGGGGGRLVQDQGQMGEGRSARKNERTNELGGGED